MKCTTTEITYYVCLGEETNFLASYWNCWCYINYYLGERVGDFPLDFMFLDDGKELELGLWVIENVEDGPHGL